MKIINLGESNSVINNIMAELRDVNIQHNKSLFRLNIERLGQIMAYEISKTLAVKPSIITTPLGIKEMKIIDAKIVIASILRAGLPLHNGLLSFFPQAESIFIAAYRKYFTETEFDIQTDYISGPSINDKVMLLADPMLATAASIVKVYQILTKNYKPVFTHIVSIISAEKGLEYIQNSLETENIMVWTCAIDPELNSHGYIVPGLGDAGDLSFGIKQ